jgi:hypothetical protein
VECYFYLLLLLLLRMLQTMMLPLVLEPETHASVVEAGLPVMP